MTLKDKSTVERLLGVIEGIALAVVILKKD